MMLRSHSEQSMLLGRPMAKNNSNETNAKSPMSMKDMSVKDMTPGVVPLYAYDANRKLAMRKIRSFGDFSVPDVDMNDDSSDQSDDTSSRPPSPSVIQKDGTMMDFQYSPQDANGGANVSLFDHHVCTGWDECVKLQKFKYDLSTTESRVVPGTLGFVAQLNEGRATKKRQTEFRVDKVNQSFDDSKFNFSKICGSEVLFRFEPIVEEDFIFPKCMDEIQQNSVFVPEWKEPPHIHESPNLVIINVSPIEYGHILLVPRVKDNLPQQVSPSTMHFALQMAAESNNPFFRIGFNSLGAYGSVNHLHFQGYYLDAPFPVERAPTVPIPGIPTISKHVRVMQLSEYPVRGMVMEIIEDATVVNPLEHLAQLCGDACRKLVENNIPHNIFIVDGGSRLFLFPQCFQERVSEGFVPEWITDTGVNPAAFEISGHLLMKARQDFDMIDQEKACKLLEQVSLNSKTFLNVCKICLSREA